MGQVCKAICLCLVVLVAGCAGSAEWDHGPHDITLLPGSQGQVTLNFTAEGSYADTYTFSATVDDPSSGVTTNVNPTEAEVDGDPVAVIVTISVAATTTATRANIKVEATDSDGEVPSATSIFVTIERP